MVEVNGPSLAEQPLGSRPLGLLLSGGAALSAWQGGALERIIGKEGFEPHTMIGTSGGALNVAGVFQGELSRLADIWTHMERDRFFKFGPRMSPPAVYRQEALRAYLESVYDEEKCRREGRGWLYIICADIHNFETFHATYSNEPAGHWDAPLTEYLLASISVPGLLPPVRIATGGMKERLLVDGHLTSFVRLNPAIERGMRDLLVINVQGKGGADLSGPRRFASSLINGLLHAQIDNGLEAALPAIRQHGVRVWELHPSKPLDIGVFRFDPGECRAIFAQGGGDAEAFLRDPDAFRRI